MSVTVRVPTTLRPLTGGASEVAVDGATVGEVFKSLEVAHPGFAERLLDDAGGLRRFVNVFVADDDHAEPEEEKEMFALQARLLEEWYESLREARRRAELAERDARLLGKAGFTTPGDAVGPA